MREAGQRFKFDALRIYLIPDRFTDSTIRSRSRACRDTDYEIHLSDEINVIAWFAGWRQYLELARRPVNGNVHEAVERAGDLIFLDAVLC